MARALALLVATSAAAPVLAALYEYEDGASAFDWLHAILPKTKAETQAAAPKTKSAIGKQPLEKVAKAILPMIVICLLVLLAVAFIPVLTLSLPALLGG